MNCGVIAVLSAVLLLGTAASAQKPIAELPRVYIDSTFHQPTGGTTCAAHNATQFSACLTSTAPGDVIVLDAGVTYTGNFYLPSKANPNNKWIYVISSALASMPEGTRVSPAVAANMPKIVVPNGTSAIYMKSGANHWRFSGIEIYSASNYHPASYPPGIYNGQSLVQNYDSNPAVLPDSFTFDRCYIHGDSTHYLQRGLTMNWGTTAVVDSYISEIYLIGAEAQGIGAWSSPGPFKITNNYISAATENILFGGAGGASQPYIMSDMEIRNNYLFKPLSWVDLSVNQKLMVVKNSFEIKNGRRVLVDSNTMENNWANGQVGFAFLLTVLNSQSGDVAVVQDITVTNNVLKNVVSGFETMTTDWLCHLPKCHNPGDASRINISNNLVTFYDPTALGGVRNTGAELNSGQDYISTPPLSATNGALTSNVATITATNSLVVGQTVTISGFTNALTTPLNGRWIVAGSTGSAFTFAFTHANIASTADTATVEVAIDGIPHDIVFQHNTMIPAASAPCWNSFVFGVSLAANGLVKSRNIWILDNVLCRDVGGSPGQSRLAFMASEPTTSPYDLAHRFYGNAMWANPADKVFAYPAHNYVSAVPFTYVNPAKGNYDLVQSKRTETSDGKLAGVDSATLPH